MQVFVTVESINQVFHDFLTWCSMQRIGGRLVERPVGDAENTRETEGKKITVHRDVCERRIADVVALVDSGRPLSTTGMATRLCAGYEQNRKSFWRGIHLTCASACGTRTLCVPALSRSKSLGRQRGFARSKAWLLRGCADSSQWIERGDGRNPDDDHSDDHEMRRRYNVEVKRHGQFTWKR